MENVIDVGVLHEEKKETVAENTIENVKNVKEETVEDTTINADDEEMTEERVNFLENLGKYITSERFDDDCNRVANKIGTSKKKVADSFGTKILGTIGDVLGITFTVTGNVIQVLLKVIYNILKGGVAIIIKVISAIVGFLTLNYTCKKPC